MLAPDLLHAGESFRFVPPARLSDRESKLMARSTIMTRSRAVQPDEIRMPISSPVNGGGRSVDSLDDWRLVFVHVGQKSGMFIVLFELRFQILTSSVAFFLQRKMIFWFTCRLFFQTWPELVL